MARDADSPFVSNELVTTYQITFLMDATQDNLIIFFGAKCFGPKIIKLLVNKLKIKNKEIKYAQQ